MGDFIASLYDAKNDPVEKWMISRAKTSVGTKKWDLVYKYSSYYYSFTFRESRERENISFDRKYYRFDKYKEGCGYVGGLENRKVGRK